MTEKISEKIFPYLRSDVPQGMKPCVAHDLSVSFQHPSSIDLKGAEQVALRLQPREKFARMRIRKSLVGDQESSRNQSRLDTHTELRGHLNETLKWLINGLPRGIEELLQQKKSSGQGADSQKNLFKTSTDLLIILPPGNSLELTELSAEGFQNLHEIFTESDAVGGKFRPTCNYFFG